MRQTRLVKALFQVFIVSLISILTVATWQSKSSQTFAQANAASQTDATWKRFTGKNEELSFLMPGEASVYENSISTFGLRRLERVYRSFSYGSAFLVVSYDNFKSIDDVASNFKKRHLDQGKMTFEREVALDNFKGKQYGVALYELVGTVQCFVVKNHAYAVAILQANDNPVWKQYFLTSLSLIKNGDNAPRDVAKGVAEPQKPAANQASNLSDSGRNAIKDNAASNAVFSSKDGIRRAIIISKPEPIGRQSVISGTVILRAVLSASGEVTKIRLVKGLPGGLSDDAIEAARIIRFIPARKDGRFVSQFIQIEYNFQ